MRTFCAKCRHSKYYKTNLPCGNQWRCHADWTRVLNRVTGKLDPVSWDCFSKNPEDGPCPKYERMYDVPVGNLIFLGFCAAWVLAALSFIICVAFFPGVLP